MDKEVKIKKPGRVSAVYVAALKYLAYILSFISLVVAIYYGISAAITASYNEAVQEDVILDANDYVLPEKRKAVQTSKAKQSTRQTSKREKDDLVKKFQNGINDALAGSLPNNEEGEPIYYFDLDLAGNVFDSIQRETGADAHAVDQFVSYVKGVFGRESIKEMFRANGDDSLDPEQILFDVLQQAMVQYEEKHDSIQEEINRVTQNKILKQAETTQNLYRAAFGIVLVLLMSIIVMLTLIEKHLRVIRVTN